MYLPGVKELSERLHKLEAELKAKAERIAELEGERELLRLRLQEAGRG